MSTITILHTETCTAREQMDKAVLLLLTGCHPTRPTGNPEASKPYSNEKLNALACETEKKAEEDDTAAAPIILPLHPTATTRGKREWQFGQAAGSMTLST